VGDKERIKDQFGQAAAQYVASPTHAAGEDLARLVELVAPSASGRLLDVATGGGHVALALAPHAGAIVACDITLAMLVEARRFISEQGFPRVECCVADAERLPFADASFSAVTCRIAFHHVPDVARAVSEVQRVLAPGGCFGFVDSMVPDDAELADFLNQVERFRDPTHLRSRTQSEWASLLEAAGFRLEAAEVFKKTHPFASWASRIGHLDAAGRGELERTFLGAPPRVAEYFRFEVEEGRLVTYTDDKLLLLGRKD
jgi:ubiquinone/menaquinone biosynthesis C-methylase UbiE